VLSEKNNNYQELIKIKNNSKELEHLKNKIKLLKQENNKIKKKLISKYENDAINTFNFTLENFKNEYSDVKSINARSHTQSPRKK
jgi:hypothetical protein